MTRAHPGGSRSGIARPLIHISMGGLAFLLRDLSWLEAIALAATAVVFNRFLLPRVGGGRLHRPGERRGFRSGIVLYPAAVLWLILQFPTRPDIAAAAWAILAAGDGMASLVGSRAGGPRIPWNRAKSMAGTAAFVVCGGAAGVLLAWWCQPAVLPPAYAWYPFAVPAAAALAAAAVETLPIGLDDNVTVAVSAAAVLWAGSFLSEDMLASAASQAAATLLPAVLANAAAAWVAWRAGTLSTSGAVTGVVIGTVIAVTAGWSGWILLMATFAAAAASSRAGLSRKTRDGIAEERGGRRGAGNALANTGLAAGAAVMSVTTYMIDPAKLAMVTALTAAGSDTVASEIGKAWGRGTWLVTTLRPVPRGTPGAMSVEGTVAGLAGAIVLGALAAALGLITGWELLPVLAGACAGALVESVLGATAEPIGLLDNDALNMINTAVAAGIAVWAASWF